MNTKECKSCFINKPLEEYFADHRQKDGLFKRCKTCYKNKVYIPKKHDVVDGKKYCSSCKKIKPVEGFYPSKKERSGYRAECIECKLEYGRKYENKSEYKKNYRARTKDYTYDYNKKYYKENKEKIKKDQLEYQKNNRHIRREADKKREKDPLYRYKNKTNDIIKVAVYRKIANSNSLSYKKQAEGILGCTLDFFISYLKSQFSSWMSFDNAGGRNKGVYKNNWQIDHIIPISLAKNEKEVDILNHWSNFQPLCAKRNNEKINSINYLTNLELNITFDSKNIII